MKKKYLISFASAMVMTASAVPFAGMAEDEMVYGTMNIPYADFYYAEFGESTNAYEVDAVSSATTSKWTGNQDGGLVQGTFNEANEDGTGRILGVTYPVAISQTDLDALGDNNYSFTALDSVPEAYKKVTLSDDGTVSFSEVVDDEIENAETSLTVETTSNWGDYCITVDELLYERGAAASSIGKLYGCIITDTDGNKYAMRHLENIWKNELGINVLEGATDMHGAPMSYTNFAGLNGATIDTITYITENGYYIYNVEPNVYLAKKVTGDISIADADISAGKTTVTANLPSDYDAEYTFDGIEASVNNSVLTFSNALAGSYSVTVSDKNGIYESLTVTLILTSDSAPASYSDGKLVKADGAEDEDFSNFIKNISVVAVNGTEYSASGRGAVKIIGEDGTIDFAATSRNENVFDGSGNYKITVSATGYNNPLDIEIKAEIPEITTTASEAISSTVTTTKAPSNNANATTTKSPSNTTTAKSSTSSATESPKTGVAGVAVPVTALTLAGVSAFVFRKKND